MVNNYKVKITVYDESNTELAGSRMMDVAEINLDTDILCNELVTLLTDLDAEDRKNNPHHYSNRED